MPGARDSRPIAWDAWRNYNLNLRMGGGKARVGAHDVLETTPLSEKSGLGRGKMHWLKGHHAFRVQRDDSRFVPSSAWPSLLVTDR